MKFTAEYNPLKALKRSLLCKHIWYIKVVVDKPKYSFKHTYTKFHKKECIQMGNRNMRKYDECLRCVELFIEYAQRLKYAQIHPHAYVHKYMYEYTVAMSDTNLENKMQIEHKC